MTDQSRPVLSFLVFAYNHEQYIADAVESALAQTYHPLEIIISDDCSTDRTFEIAQEIVARYRGPHRVKLNKNSNNMGLAEHFNKVMNSCTGEFVITAGGDDISSPERSKVLFNEWDRLERCDCSIFSNAVVIDDSNIEHGLYYKDIRYSRNISDFIDLRTCWVGGFSHGFSIELFKKFGPMPANTFQEDGVISFRAALCSGIYYIDHCLVRYRRHGGNSYSTEHFEKFLKLCRSEQALAGGRIKDLESCPSLLSEPRAAALKILRAESRKKWVLGYVPGVALIYFSLRKLKRLARSGFASFG